MERQIIYVDAGGDDTKGFRISLYHLNKKDRQVMALKDVTDIHEAERYAIYYALFHVKRHNLDNTIILSDNRGAINDKVLMFLSDELNVKFSWIPRELNENAFNILKDVPTKNSEFEILKIFIRLSKKSYIKELQSSFFFDMEKLKVKEKNVEKLRAELENELNDIKKLKEEQFKLKNRIKDQEKH